MTVVILLGGIDLSVGSVLAFSGMITSIIVEQTGGTLSGIFFGCAAGVIVGGTMGLITGVLISRLGLPDFIASLAMMEIARGAALLTTSGLSSAWIPHFIYWAEGSFLENWPSAVFSGYFLL